MATLDVSVHLSLLSALANARLVYWRHKVLFDHLFGSQIWMVRTEIRNYHLKSARVKFYVWLVIYKVCEH